MAYACVRSCGVIDCQDYAQGVCTATNVDIDADTHCKTYFKASRVCTSCGVSVLSTGSEFCGHACEVNWYQAEIARLKEEQKGGA